MKKSIITRPQGKIQLALCVSIVLLIILVVYVISDVSREIGQERRERESERYLKTTELFNLVREFTEVNAESDKLQAYYLAKTAEREAAMLGEIEWTKALERVVRDISESGECSGDALSVVEEMLGRGFLYQNEESKDETKIEEESQYKSVRSIERTSAGEIPFQRVVKANAERVLGSDHILREVVKSAEGERILTCRNAVFIMDEKTALPTSFCISMKKSSEFSDSTALLESAKDFLLEFYAGEEDIKLDISEVTDNGMRDIVFSANGVSGFISLSGNTGRVVRLVTQKE